MNSHKLSLALVTVATILSVSILHSHASPSKGVICTTGFTGESVDGGFRCKKVVPVLIANICTNPQFPKLNIRAKVPSGTPNDFNKNGRDVCSKANATIPAMGPLIGLTEGSDFLRSLPNPNAKRRAEEILEQAFASGRVAIPALARRREVIVLPTIPPGQREAIVARQEPRYLNR